MFATDFSVSNRALSEYLARLLSRGEAAQRLGVGVLRFSQLVAAGQLPYAVTALGRLYDPRDVDALKARRAAKKG